jgi:hypothetical protein
VCAFVAPTSRKREGSQLEARSWTTKRSVSSGGVVVPDPRLVRGRGEVFEEIDDKRRVKMFVDLCVQ